MQCAKPIVLAGGVCVPCGRCHMCRLAVERMWCMRLSHEQSVHLNGVFITLTYNDDYLPDSLSKRHVQLALKRLRKMLNHLSIRYMMTGEYGDSFGRPHYHGIIFGVPWCEWKCRKLMISGEWRYSSDVLCDVWPMGYNTIADVSYPTIKYVCKYIHKQLNGPLGREVYGDLERPFALKSQGLGKEFVLRNKDQLMLNYNVKFHGHDIALPKYYKKKLYGESKEDRLYLSYRNDMLYQEYLGNVPGVTQAQKEEAIIRRNRGKEKKIIKDLKEKGLEGM